MPVRATRARPASFLAARVCRAPGFLMACASSRTTRSQRRRLEPGQPQQRAVARDHEVGAVRAAPAGASRSSSAGRAEGWASEHPQAGREAARLGDPVGEERRRRHQQARAPPVSRVALQHGQQREHLDRLAEAHVVGQAGAEAELVEEVEPADARPAGTGGASCAARRPARRGRGPPGRRRPSSVSASHGPATTRDQSGSARRGVVLAGHAAPASIRSASAKLTPFAPGLPLRAPQLVERLAQAVGVDLDPLAADEGEPVRAREEPRDLVPRQRLPVERHVEAEVEQGVRRRGRTGACRPRWP